MKFLFTVVSCSSFLWHVDPRAFFSVNCFMYYFDVCNKGQAVWSVFLLCGLAWHGSQLCVRIMVFI